jgi:uncharacterized membrane protein YhaH (DUF805 family)
MDFAQLGRWNGRVDRRTYGLVGLVGFAIKHNIDRAIAMHFFPVGQTQLSASFFNYWAPLGRAARLTHLSPTQSRFLGAMLLAALPFIWIGLSMTVRRLRDAHQPPWLAALFFVPFVNLVFFALLCVLPTEANTEVRSRAGARRLPFLDRVIPRSRTGSAVFAIALTSAIGLACVLLGATYAGAFGWSLFVGLPFCLGLFSVLTFSYHERRELGECMAASILPVGILALGLVAVAVEGVVCIVMAAPLALVLAALGGWAGYSIQAVRRLSGAPTMMSIVLLALPVSFGVERAVSLEPSAFVVRSAVEINAPPEMVWRQVIAFAEIPPPTELLFRSGIAYPIRAEISGTGPGAVRRCVFSTGPFIEPIEVWDEPRLLRFSVAENPAPLNELTPYGHIEPRHLHGYFASEHGQFLLTPLPGGRTRLEGTTWCRDAIWPAAYWRAWSDYIVHRIHLRVLEHIKSEVEGASGLEYR